jgi:hypothetical protein
MHLWEYVISGHHIVLCDQEGLLAYGVMDEVHMRRPGMLLSDSMDDNESLKEIEKDIKEVVVSSFRKKDA